MNVYHLVSLQYGLENLRRRRLKIATLEDLNDPFEFRALELSNRTVRSAIQLTREQLSKTSGLLCFFKDWWNPVLWSHYADRHRGVCLGFEVPDSLLTRVAYGGRRLLHDLEALEPKDLNEELMAALACTKYAHWRYEREFRAFVGLEDRDTETGLYFADFSDNLRPTHVIAGALSSVGRTEIDEAIGGLVPRPIVFKARLAFRSYRVVRNRNESLWN